MIPRISLNEALLNKWVAHSRQRFADGVTSPEEHLAELEFIKACVPHIFLRRHK